MLAKRRRLRAEEVRTVIARGHAARATYLSLKYMPDKSGLRAAVVVSKKVAKGAVARNRLRRAAYRALASHHGRAQAVFFVLKSPTPPLQSAFAADLATLAPRLQ